jgi:hypothetical protein
MNLDGFPGIRLLRINAAITYVECIKKARGVFLLLLWLSMSLLLMCAGLILIGMSFLREFNMNVFLFGAAIFLISAILLGLMASQRTWIRLFKIDQLIENIKKGDLK